MESNRKRFVLSVFEKSDAAPEIFRADDTHFKNKGGMRRLNSAAAWSYIL